MNQKQTCWGWSPVLSLLSVSCCLPVGQPKGVLLTHKALIASVATVAVYLREYANVKVGPGHTFLSFLPLAHIFDRCVCFLSSEQCLLHIVDGLGMAWAPLTCCSDAVLAQ